MSKGRGQSYKPAVINILFERRKIGADGQIEDPVVLKDEVSEVLEQLRAQGRLKKKEGRNPANFFKDIIRWDEADSFWPDQVFERGFTARQRTGDDSIFEFVRKAEGQIEKFPNPYWPSSDLDSQPIQTASVNAVAKSLGIASEAWMMQVLVQIKLIETHFSIRSPRRSYIRQIDHLQTGKKGSKAEIDGLFMALEETKDGESSALITVEAKGEGERIIAEQIEQQVSEAIKIARKTGAKRRDVTLIVPCAVKSIKGRGIYFVEYLGFPQSAWKPPFHLEVASQALYRLEPPIKGI